MLEKRDYIYYDYRFKNIEPKATKWKIYCILRRFITIYESPSKVTLWDLDRHFLGNVGLNSKK